MAELSTLGTVIATALPNDSITPAKLAHNLLGAAAESDHTISAGVITPTNAATRVDTEAAATSDDLTNMLLTNFPAGTYLFLRIVSGTRQVTVKHLAGGTGQIQLADSADFTLTNSTQFLLLRAFSATWVEVDRSWGSQKAQFRTWLGVPEVGDVAFEDILGTAFLAAGAVLQPMTGGSLTPGSIVLDANRRFDHSQSGTVNFVKGTGSFVDNAQFEVEFTGDGSAINWTSDFVGALRASVTAEATVKFIFRWNATNAKIEVYANNLQISDVEGLQDALNAKMDA